MANFKSNTHDGRSMQLSVTETVNQRSNSSTLHWTLSSVGGNAVGYTTDTTTVSINGVQVYYKERTPYGDRVFPAITGSVSGSLEVAHDPDGTKTVTIGFSTRVYYHGPNEYGGSMTLTPTDRTAPTVSCSVSAVTAHGFTVSAGASAAADEWLYSTDGGSAFSPLSATQGTQITASVSGLTPNTPYSVKVKARKSSNHVYGVSSAVSVRTLGGSLLDGVQTLSADVSSPVIRLTATVFNASYRHRLKILKDNATVLEISNLAWSAGTSERTITLSTSQRSTLLQAMSSLKSFTAVFELRTFSGTAQIGDAAVAQASVTTSAANSAPAMTDFTFRDGNTLTSGITGDSSLLIRNHSVLYVRPGNVFTRNGASVAGFTISCNGVTVSTAARTETSLGTVSRSGDVQVIVTVTDSRGYTASSSRTVTVLPYESPKVAGVSLRRTNNIEAEMQLSFSGSFSPLTIGSAAKNALTAVSYRTKKTNEETWGDPVSILGSVSVTGASFSFSSSELCLLDSASSHDFRLQIADRLGEAAVLNLDFVVPQGTPLIALRKNRVGVNTPDPQAALHAVGDAIISGTLTAGALSAPVDAASLTGILPLSAGGTGASTAAAAAQNLGVLPKSGGAMTGQITASGNASSWIAGRDKAPVRGNAAANATNFYPVLSSKTPSGSWEIGTYGEDLCFSRTTDTDYAAGRNAATVRRISSGGNFDGKADNVTGVVAIANGGTGASEATAARTSLGIKCTLLYGGSMSSGSTSFHYGGFKAYVIVGKPSNGASLVSLVIPREAITTTDTTWQLTDESNYRMFSLRCSGSTVTMTVSGGTGLVTAVYGMN